MGKGCEGRGAGGGVAVTRVSGRRRGERRRGRLQNIPTLLLLLLANILNTRPGILGLIVNTSEAFPTIQAITKGGLSPLW